MNSSTPNIVRTIRLSDAQIEELLKRRDASRKTDFTERRTASRVRYRMKGCVFQYHVQGCSESTSFAIYPLDLSADGFAFLHGGFVHPGTACTMQLMSSFGTWTEVKARVIRCELLQGNIHEVAVRLLARVEPADLSPDAFKPRILLVDDHPLTRKLGLKVLKELNAEVDEAVNGEEAVALAQAKTFDAILMDLEMPVMDGYEAVRRLREKGYTGTIVALTAMTQAEDEAKCRANGFDDFVRKPYDAPTMTRLIQSLRQEPLISTMSGDAEMSPLIEEFVKALHEKLASIETLLAKQDLQQLEIALRSLKGEAGGFGFDPITQAAAKAEQAIFRKAGPDEVRKATVDLLKLARVARAPAKLQ